MTPQQSATALKTRAAINEHQSGKPGELLRLLSDGRRLHQTIRTYLAEWIAPPCKPGRGRPPKPRIATGNDIAHRLKAGTQTQDDMRVIVQLLTPFKRKAGPGRPGSPKLGNGLTRRELIDFAIREEFYKLVDSGMSTGKAYALLAEKKWDGKLRAHGTMKSIVRNERREITVRPVRPRPADAVMWSGCADPSKPV